MIVDRVRAWRRRTIAAGAAGALACVGSAAWSVHSARAVAPRLPETRLAAPPVDAPSPGPEPLEMRGFSKLLSAPPPPAPPTSDDKTTAEGARFSLLGISEGPDGLVAAVHDRADDRVHFVREGDTLGKVTVTRVASREIEIGGAAEASGSNGAGRGETSGGVRMRLVAPKPPGGSGSTTPPAAEKGGA